MKHQMQSMPMKMIEKTQKEIKLMQLLTFMSQILPDDEIPKGINSLNSKQRKVFNVLHTWVKLM